MSVIDGFDEIGHLRMMKRIAERRASALERHRDQLERVLALALRVATANGRDADPLVTLDALLKLDDLVQSQPPERTIDELVLLLRETDPDRIRVKATA